VGRDYTIDIRGNVMVGKNILWQEELAKAGGSDLVKVLEEILGRLDVFDKKQDKMEMTLEGLRKAFPDGDMEGHRRYHQEMIEVLQERKKFYREITKKTIIGLLWFLLVWLAMATYHELQTTIQSMVSK